MSSKLLEIAINNRKIINEDLNLSGLLKRNERLNFFNTVNDIDEVPIEPKKVTWEQVDDHEKTFLTKTFNFQMQKHLIYFLNELIRKSNEVEHHPQIIINNNEIVIETYTHDINDITEADLSLIKFMDELYEDIEYINRF